MLRYSTVSHGIIFKNCMKYLSIDPNTLQIARDMQKNALCFYSKFQVGAAIQTEENQIVGGCNIESASYGLTICAERVAIFSALAQGYKKITHIALVTDTGSFPCGACRQILYEFCKNAHITIFSNIDIKK
ncbi:cytidine deaminase [Candidatus Dependentiae bacterium]|nr:cytidine deaminase [Candidatus Dependentiae bacterium]